MKITFTLISCLLFAFFSDAQDCSNWLKINAPLDAITIGDLDISGDKMTIEANFNATGNITRTLVSKHYYQIDVNYHLLPDIAQITTSNGFYQVMAPCDFTKNKNYHVAMVYDGAFLKLYRNGYLMGSTPASGQLVTNDWPTAIGENAYGVNSGNLANTHPMEGYINEVRIWNVARTQAEIKAYMFSSLPAPASQTGLRAYYTFNNLVNKQGNAIYNGVIKNNATINNINSDCNFMADSCFTTLNCNNWLKINAPLDAITIGDLDISGDKMTIEANFNATGNITRTLVSKHYYQIDVNYHLLPDIAQITTSNGFYQVMAPCDFTKNKNYHVAMVYDGAFLKFYRNGYLMGSTPASGQLVTNDWPTAIGENAYGVNSGNLANTHPMEGYINEVRIWNVARTQAEIKAYMFSSLPAPASQTGLRAYYAFNNLVNKQGNAIYNGVIKNNATINNINSDCNFMADSCFTTLPVQITLFETNVQQNKEVRLLWKIEAESNISYYAIERYNNSTGKYTNIGQLNAGNIFGANTYQFIDKLVQPGNVYNYRIGVHEISGKVIYSNIRSVRINGKQAFVIFPNPSNGLIQYQISDFKGTAQVKLVNHLGQIILSKSVYTDTQLLNLDIRQHPAGIYTLMIDAGQQHFVVKVSKL